MMKAPKKDHPIPTDNVHKLDLEKDKIGIFIGQGGKNIFSHVVIPAKQSYCKISKGLDEHDFELHIKVIHDDETEEHSAVWNNIDGIDMKVMNPLIIESLQKSSKFIKEMKKKNHIKKKSSKSKNSWDESTDYKEYAIKVNVDPRYIGKLIGTECCNLNILKDSIKQALEISHVFVKLHDDGPGNQCDEIKTKYDGGGSGVWFQIKFKHKKKVFKQVFSVLEKFMDDQFVEDSDEEEDEHAQGDW